MSTNLEGYKRNNNKDWSEWVKLVKKAYKSQGHTLTQQQALIIAKQSYPGKGNVIGRETELEGTVPVKGDEIPENPVRRKKEPAPKKEPRVQKERGRRERDEEPRRRRKNTFLNLTNLTKNLVGVNVIHVNVTNVMMNVLERQQKRLRTLKYHHVSVKTRRNVIHLMKIVLKMNDKHEEESDTFLNLMKVMTVIDVDEKKKTAREEDIKNKRSLIFVLVFNIVINNNKNGNASSSPVNGRIRRPRSCFFTWKRNRGKFDTDGGKSIK
jgi:hypothetical protein